MIFYMKACIRLWCVFIIETHCVSWEVSAEAAETVEHRAWAIVNIEYGRLMDIDCKSLPLRYLLVTCFTSGAKILKNLTACVTVLSVTALSVTALSVTVLSVTALSVTALSVTECYSTECYSTECYSTECYSTECYSTECYSTECYSIECYSTECYRVLQHWVLQHWVLQYWVLQHWVLQYWVLQYWVLQYWVLQHWVLQYWVLQRWVLQHWVLQHWVSYGNYLRNSCLGRIAKRKCPNNQALWIFSNFFCSKVRILILEESFIKSCQVPEISFDDTQRAVGSTIRVFVLSFVNQQYRIQCTGVLISP
jgi:hypothetical protein